MFEQFGNFDSAEALNETANGLRREQDYESIRKLAEENGIDEEIADAFIDGDVLYICDVATAAIGKLEVEKKALDCAEIMEDWVSYIEAECFENENMAEKVRKADKSLSGCIAELLKWGFGHQHEISADIKKAANVSAGRVTLGIPGMGTAKRIIREHYLGK